MLLFLSTFPCIIKKKIYVDDFQIYTPGCTYFTITLRDICIYHYLLFNLIFGTISCISW